MKIKDRVFRQTVGAFLVRQKNAASSYSSSSSSSSLSTSSLPPPSSASFIHSFIHSFSSSYFAFSSSTFDLLFRAPAETQGVTALSRCLPGDLATLHVVTVPLWVTGLLKRVSEQGSLHLGDFFAFSANLSTVPGQGLPGDVAGRLLEGVANPTPLSSADLCGHCFLICCLLQLLVSYLLLLFLLIHLFIHV